MTTIMPYVIFDVWQSATAEGVPTAFCNHARLVHHIRLQVRARDTRT